MSEEADVIEREIRIAARPETVFSFFTDPEKMILWKGISATLDPQPGGVYRIQINETDIVQGKYMEVVPYSRIVFSWGWEGKDHPLPPGASTVEFLLIADGSETIVRLRHVGVPASLRHQHIQGWDFFLPRLINVVENRGPDNSG